MFLFQKIFRGKSSIDKQKIFRDKSSIVMQNKLYTIPCGASSILLYISDKKSKENFILKQENQHLEEENQKLLESSKNKVEIIKDYNELDHVSQNSENSQQDLKNIQNNLDRNTAIGNYNYNTQLNDINDKNQISDISLRKQEADHMLSYRYIQEQTKEYTNLGIQEAKLKNFFIDNRTNLERKNDTHQYQSSYTYEVPLDKIPNINDYIATRWYQKKPEKDQLIKNLTQMLLSIRSEILMIIACKERKKSNSESTLLKDFLFMLKIRERIRAILPEVNLIFRYIPDANIQTIYINKLQSCVNAYQLDQDEINIPSLSIKEILTQLFHMVLYVYSTIPLAGPGLIPPAGPALAPSIYIILRVKNKIMELLLKICCLCKVKADVLNDNYDITVNGISPFIENDDVQNISDLNQMQNSIYKNITSLHNPLQADIISAKRILQNIFYLIHQPIEYEKALFSLFDKVNFSYFSNPNSLLSKRAAQFENMPLDDLLEAGKKLSALETQIETKLSEILS